MFADPPFNIGFRYDLYHDRKSRPAYLAWARQWLEQCKRVLRPNGALWVAIGSHLQAEVKCLIDDVGFEWRDTVVWHYTFGPRQETKLTPSWVALHYAINLAGGAVPGSHWHYDNPERVATWNNTAPEVRVPSARQLKYADKRANSEGKLPDNVWCLLPGEFEGRGVFMPGQNTWLHSRVCGTFKERTLHPCQMPVAVLERIIALTSNPGDVVLDPFLGSGTTAEAAHNLGRRCWGVELSLGYINSIVIPRIEELQENKSLFS